MATGKDLVKLARKHLSESYVLGVAVPKDNPRWTGPWDCAEFASWCVYQVSQQLYGCDNDSGAPDRADAYSGYWARDAKKLGQVISVSQAASIPGSFVIRQPQLNLTGHVVMSDGDGGTIEAHSSATGVIASTLNGRRWDLAVLVPWISYSEVTAPTETIQRPRLVLRMQEPPMQGSIVKDVQRALKALNLHPGPIDGIYGPQTTAAVAAFQLQKGLLGDGEVGVMTASALGIQWP